MTSTQVAYQTMLETKRSNLAREAETERTNRENERIRDYSAKTDRYDWKLRKSKLPFEKGNSMADMFYKVSSGAEKQTKAVKNVGDMISIIGSLFS